mgnify:CR=1 FL=1
MDNLLSDCLRGNKPAWDAFVDRYGPVIYSAVRRVLGRGDTGSGPAADDVAQDVFYKLVRDDSRLLRSYDPARSSLSTWLTIVSRSTAIDALRRRRPAALPLADAPLPVSPPLEPPAEAPTAAVPPGVLSARQMLVLRMLFDRQMPPQDVAAALGIRVQTVRSTKHKAIERLREHFHVKDSP